MKKILIVDDDETILMMIATRLKASQYDVLTAANGLEAIERANQWKPDLILLDIMLPLLNGYEACKRLKAEQETRDIPVVIISAYRELGEKAVCAGAVSMLIKPFNSVDVLQITDRELGIEREDYA